MKKTITLLTIFCISILLLSCNKKIMDENKEYENEEIIEKETNEENNFILDGTYTFTANKLMELMDYNESFNLVLENELIILKDINERAIYQSKEIKVKAFEELVLSFNLRDLNSGSITFMVSIGKEDQFSEFYVMGSWLNGKYRSMSGQNDDFAKVNIDTLVNKNINNDLIKLRIVINPGKETKLKNITITTKKNNINLSYDENDLINKVLEVPKIAQLSVPNIGNLICSPTSITMVLNYYQNDFDVKDVANDVLDSVANIYGNWTFNTSYAGSIEGLIGYVEYINDFKDVINYIKNDIPVVFSITTNAISDLEGSIMSYPQGHLIVLIGFEEINGKWYGVFNDPAEYEDIKVERKYSMDQILEAWKLYSYIIKKG